MSYADKRIEELISRRRELDLLESDMLEMRQKLVDRLDQLKKEGK